MPESPGIMKAMPRTLSLPANKRLTLPLYPVIVDVESTANPLMSSTAAARTPYHPDVARDTQPDPSEPTGTWEANL